MMEWMKDSNAIPPPKAVCGRRVRARVCVDAYACVCVHMRIYTYMRTHTRGCVCVHMWNILMM